MTVHRGTLRGVDFVDLLIRFGEQFHSELVLFWGGVTLSVDCEVILEILLKVSLLLMVIEKKDTED